MLVQVTYDVYPFCIVLFTFCAVFVMVTAVLEIHYDPIGYNGLEDYRLMVNIIQTFRNSIGDISNPLYELGDTWFHHAEMAVTWLFFIFNVFIMQIVLLNFLVAEVSMTYDRIKNLGPCLMFQKKHELNFFVLKVNLLFG